MRRLSFLIAVALTVGAPATAYAQSSNAPVTSQPISRASAAALAGLIAPTEIMIPLEIEQARRAILSLPTVDPDAKQLDHDYPGIYAAVWEAVAPEMRRQSEADLPKYRAVLENLYLQRLSEAEAQGLLTFYRSPTGQKMIRNMYGSVDITPMIASIVQSESAAVSASQMQAMVDKARRETVQQITPDDHGDLIALAKAIDLSKARAIGAETQKLTLDWVNKSDPDAEAKIAEIMATAAEKFIAAHPAKD